MNILEINDLSKHYGNKKAVENLNLKVEQGSIFGFLGLNGAGKTTTIRMIMGLTKPTTGDIAVCGDKVNFGSTFTNKHIGYLPDVPEFYGFMRSKEYLELCGKLSGMNSMQIEEKVTELLTLVGLENEKHTIRGFSRGMKQRLGIAQALIHNPELLILDEPTSALDPIGRKEILDIISTLKGKMTVMFSTHILSDVERICDTIGILHNGSLSLEGDLNEIQKNYAHQSIIIETAPSERIDQLIDTLSKMTFIKNIKKEAVSEEKSSRLSLRCSNLDELYKAICPILSELELPLKRFEQVESKLEDVFIEVIKDE